MLVAPKRLSLEGALDRAHERLRASVGDVIALAKSAGAATPIRLPSKLGVAEARELVAEIAALRRGDVRAERGADRPRR